MVESVVINRKTRGRPKKSQKVNLIGLPKEEKKVAYKSKTNYNKRKTLLLALIDKDHVRATLNKEYNVNVDDIKHLNESSLRDIFLDEEVDISILKYDLSEPAMVHLENIIKLKDPNKYTCHMCKQSAVTNVVLCDSCLSWVHFKCGGIKEPKALEGVVWYCLECEKNFLKKKNI